MKERIKNYIPLALQYIKENLATEDDAVDEKYDGYAASLGPAIITSGLLPAIAFYTDLHRSGDANVRRFKIINIISSIISTDGVVIPNCGQDNALLEYLIIPSNDTPAIKDKILDAIVAVKLAFRNFKHV